MVDGRQLLTDLKPLRQRLQDDLRERSQSVPELRDRLNGEWQAARSRERTAQAYEDWREDYLAQAAVMWVLGCVFARFLEDNGLVGPPRLAAEGVDLHLNCRFVIHHDLCWNPSTLEQRTGRVDRIGSKAERVKQPINVYMPYVAETQDEKMFRVVRDRERWFQIVMGETYEVDEAATDKRAARIPLPDAVQQQLAMRLHP